jgi:hypothetical protein
MKYNQNTKDMRVTWVDFTQEEESLFSELDKLRNEKVSNMQHHAQIKKALNLFYNYKLADTLALLQQLRYPAHTKEALVLEGLRKNFSTSQYSAENGWNSSAAPLEEQITLFRALESTFNVIFGWEVPAHNPFALIPQYIVADPHYEKKKEHLLKGTQAFKVFLSKMPRQLDISIADRWYAYLQLSILRGNIIDDLSCRPEQDSGSEKFMIDDRNQYLELIRNSRNRRIAIIPDNNGIETLLILFETWLLLNSGKKVTIFTKQEPTIISDTTYSDLLLSINIFEKVIAMQYPNHSFMSLQKHLEDENLFLRQLPYRYEYRGEAHENGRVVSTDFRFLQKYDTAIFQGELNYGIFVREQLRRLKIMVDHTQWIGLQKLNPFNFTTVVLRKANKNPRETNVIEGWVTAGQVQPTQGEFVFQLLEPRIKKANHQ